MKISINISDLIHKYTEGAPVMCSYWGDLNPAHWLEEDEEINVTTFRKELEAHYMTLAQEYLASHLSQYGITIKAVEMDCPKEYNFGGDLFYLDCELNTETFIMWMPRLVPLISHYMKEVREKSRDGYISFEPSAWKEITFNSPRSWHAIAWAIFEHSDLWEDAKEIHVDMLEGVAELVSECTHKQKQQEIFKRIVKENPDGPTAQCIKEESLIQTPCA